MLCTLPCCFTVLRDYAGIEPRDMSDMLCSMKRHETKHKNSYSCTVFWCMSMFAIKGALRNVSGFKVDHSDVHIVFDRVFETHITQEKYI